MTSKLVVAAFVAVAIAKSFLTIAEVPMPSGWPAMVGEEAMQ